MNRMFIDIYMVKASLLRSHIEMRGMLLDTEETVTLIIKCQKIGVNEFVL